MSKRASYHNEHLDEKRRRKGALERLEFQLAELKKNNSKYLFLNKEEQPTPDKFKFKITYVGKQIESIKNKPT